MGKLIVIEGTDGSGKSTQFRLLTQRLENENIAFQKIVFPQYSEPSSALIRMYLGGEFGTNPSDVNAYAASSFYAVDRYASYKKAWEPENKRQEFLKWLYEFEYDRLGLPRPDLTLYLDVPTDFTEQLLRHREQDTHTTADIHERNSAYLASCRRTGRAAAEYYGWTIISCTENGKMRSIEDIHEEIYRHVAACLED